MGSTARFTAAIAAQSAEQRDHADRLHREAMAAIAEQRDHADKLHGEAMATIAKQGERMVDLHLQADGGRSPRWASAPPALETKAGWR